MKLQADHFKPEKGSSKTPAERHRQYLDFLLTALYQPITQNWLQKHLGEGEIKRERAEAKWAQIMRSLMAELNQSKERESISPLESTNSAQTVWVKGVTAVPDLPEKTGGMTTSCGAGALCLRLWETSIQDTSTVLQQTHQMLASGGALVMELISFSGFKAYPYHYSFTRTVDLIGELEINQSFPAHLPGLLKQIGFERIERVYSPPAFLPKEYNRIISVCMKAFRKEILLQPGTSKKEIDALTPSLKQFEEQKDTLISRPGVHLLLAGKI